MPIFIYRNSEGGWAKIVSTLAPILLFAIQGLLVQMIVLEAVNASADDNPWPQSQASRAQSQNVSRQNGSSTGSYDAFLNDLKKKPDAGQSTYLQQAQVNLALEAQSLAIKLFDSRLPKGSEVNLADLKKKFDKNADLNTKQDTAFKNSIHQYCTASEKAKIAKKDYQSKKICFERFYRNQAGRFKQIEGEMNKLSESLRTLTDDSNVPLVDKEGFIPQDQTTAAKLQKNSQGNQETRAVIPSLMKWSALEERNRIWQKERKAEAADLQKLKASTQQLTVEEVQKRLPPPPDEYAFSYRKNGGAGGDFERDQNGKILIDREAYEKALHEHQVYLQMEGAQTIRKKVAAPGRDIAAWEEYWRKVDQFDPHYRQGENLFGSRDGGSDVDRSEDGPEDLMSREAFLRARASILVLITERLNDLGYQPQNGFSSYNFSDRPGDPNTIEQMKEAEPPKSARKPSHYRGTERFNIVFPFEKYPGGTKKHYPGN